MAERHRCEIDRMIDKMLADGAPEQDILSAIGKHYKPYDKFAQFVEGFADH
jgi:hypothetical protein